MLGGVMNLEPLGDAPGLGRPKRLIELGIVHVHQILDLMRPIHRSASLSDW